MNVLQQKNITEEIYDFIVPLKYKNNYIALLGTAGLQSQLYPSDLDLFCIITTKETPRTLNDNIRNILYKVSLCPNMYFIEAKNQYTNGDKNKYFHVDDYKFDKSISELDFIKLDFVIYINYNFLELSIIYSFKLIDDMPILSKQLKDDITTYKNDGMYYKALKRLFAIYKLQQENNIDNSSILVLLSRFFNSNVGMIYKRNSQLKAIKLLMEHYDDISVLKKIKIALDDMKLYSDIDIDKVIKNNDKLINDAAFEFINNENIKI